MKTCKACGVQCGPRKKVCDCGQSFDSKTKTKPKKPPLVPEPGQWIADITKGMPKICPPEPLPKRGKLDIEAMRDYISYEGLGFCVYEYIPHTRIEDAELRKLWSAARKSLQKIVERIYDEE
jgi:hypothetical protein